MIPYICRISPTTVGKENERQRESETKQRERERGGGEIGEKKNSENTSRSIRRRSYHLLIYLYRTATRDWVPVQLLNWRLE